jgi:hypothetical protein
MLDTLSDERKGLSFTYAIASVPCQSLSGPSHAELMTIFYCLIWDSANLEDQIRVFISPRNRGSELYPRGLGSLSVASCNAQGYDGGILARLHMGSPDWFPSWMYLYSYIVAIPMQMFLEPSWSRKRLCWMYLAMGVYCSFMTPPSAVVSK